MNLHDDPRLTRYALGEMNDDERAAFEREMTEADRREIESIRALAGALTTELKAEPTPVAQAFLPASGGTPPEDFELRSNSGRNVGATELRSRRPARTRWILAAAASVAVVGLVGSIMLPSLNRARESSDFGKRRALALAQLRAVDAMPLETKPSASAVGAVKDQTNNLYARLRAEGSRPSLIVGRESHVPAQASEALTYWKKASFDGNDSFLLPVDERVDTSADTRLSRTHPSEAPTADSYARIHENPFLDPRVAPLSTFGIDVDTASYANVRRFLTNGALPPADAVRVEELINYFPTSDAPPTDGRPFATYADVARCPWNASRQLVRVALKAREVDVDQRPPSNLVFLVDVSGSMNSPDRLPLVKRGLQRLVDRLGENDRVAIVVYAGSSGLALPSTNAGDKAAIRRAIDNLEAGGSTNGGQGIELAYRVAQSNFLAGGANRVVLCTDGDFNVGVTDRGQLTSMVVDRAKAGVFLSVLGFGRGNLKDDTMESLANKGNGNYAYIDSDREAQKVLVEQASGTLVAVAKDVKIQIEFNPAAVRSYRLIGYENRLLAKEDFNNDLKDAGEIGAGHSVVALYEIEPAGQGHLSAPAGEGLKYQRVPTPAVDANVAELLTLKLRYKAPDAPLEQGTSELIERTLSASDRSIDQASPDFQFAAAVAGFGMMLRGSAARGDVDWPMIARLAKAGLGADVGGHRAEFVTLVDRAAGLMTKPQ